MTFASFGKFTQIKSAAACKQEAVVVSIDFGTLYNTQLLFDADGTLIQRRRKITPTYNERIIWGQGDGWVCAPLTARSAVLASWPGSSTTLWRGTR